MKKYIVDIFCVIPSLVCLDIMWHIILYSQHVFERASPTLGLHCWINQGHFSFVCLSYFPDWDECAVYMDCLLKCSLTLHVNIGLVVMLTAD